MKGAHHYGQPFGNHPTVFVPSWAGPPSQNEARENPAPMARGGGKISPISSSSRDRSLRSGALCPPPERSIHHSSRVPPQFTSPSLASASISRQAPTPPHQPGGQTLAERGISPRAAMDSAVLSLTCAGLGAPEEDDDGAVAGYTKSEHCLGIAPQIPTPLPHLLRFASISIRDAEFAKFCCVRVSADNLKDLQRFLRRDDPQRREVFKQVCKWKIASRDLVPIIENYQAERTLVITAGKLFFLLLPRILKGL